ncbi:MAG: SLC13 family permease [candidate division KSB1 bacterium]|nr:SLC13 family permease [candidate division KSB1 bacterium]MDZ7274532.1 SLC13 family permease [candidate division KSB1 bacterium]MDZ7284807.1 SLC13 family permease [candidate division KSB1 bacterium]MDZ7297773.1 SLC13 family permease [candidate division KSB1 bacterium]MDZ7306438.1 SLC13 family permease [candidate division KSB1 bacterium]
MKALTFNQEIKVGVAPLSAIRQIPWRQALLMLMAVSVAAAIWWGLPDLSVHARIAFITFGLAVIGWVGTDIDDTYIALAAALVFSAAGIDEPNEFFETLGDSTIWLLLSSFVIAAAVTTSGLSRRLTARVAAGARSVSQLFYLLTAVLLLTAFLIPATSGRAALMVPVFAALSSALPNRRIVVALALLFPTIIELSAIASLIGAGANLVTAEILWRMSGDHFSFSRWLLLGLPFALVSCFASTWVILHLFLTPAERRQALALGRLALPPDKNGHPATTRSGHFSRREWQVLLIGAVVIVLWMTESLHGLNSTIVAILGALAVTMPGLGVISFKEGVKGVNWTLLLFMAATLELGEALVESGGAAWLVKTLFTLLRDSDLSSTLIVTAAIATLALLSHLLITSRIARTSVLIPPVVLLALSLGYNPTTLAFLATAAAAFCLTLPTSAKPVAMFCQLDGTTYQPRDLLKLSSVLLPLHLVLLLVFALGVWPMMGLSLKRDPLTTPPSPTWQQQTGLPAIREQRHGRVQAHVETAMLQLGQPPLAAMVTRGDSTRVANTPFLPYGSAMSSTAPLRMIP